MGGGGLASHQEHAPAGTPKEGMGIVRCGLPT